MIKKAIALALAATTALGSASAASATPVEGSLDAHDSLITALRSNGINVVANPASCNSPVGSVDGFYSSSDRLIAICQDNSYPGGPAVGWTPNDLDTLRHEAQHFIQDCMVGTNDDGLLNNVYREPIGFAEDTLTYARIKQIITNYSNVGADDHTIVLELEAFSVAYRNIPLEQAGDIATFCK